MKLTEDIKPVTSTHEDPCRGAGDASLLLQLTSQSEVDVQEGRTMPQSQVFVLERQRLAREK